MATPTPPKDPSRSAQAVDYSNLSLLELAALKAKSKNGTPLPELRLPPIKPLAKSSPGVAASAEVPPPLPQSPTPAPTPAAEPFVLEKWSNASLPAVQPARSGSKSQLSVSSIPPVSTDGRSGSTPNVELGRIGPYQLRQLIGEGGMGLVYQAEDVLLKRMVALKVMKPELGRASAAWRLFLKEAQTTAAIKNDRIATIYQVGEAGDHFYLAMELLKGETLETRLRRGRLSLKHALWVAREAALGLAVAHEAGLVHRDIKPANLWLESKTGSSSQIDRLQQYRMPLPGEDLEAHFGRLKILDFGLAQLAHESSGRSDTSGTPGYMAPEQAAGLTGDERTDIFSLGVVLFRMVTGQMPFQGNTPMELLTAVATQAAPLAAVYNPTLPPNLVRLIQKMLSHDPVARPTTAAEVAIAIDRIESEMNRPPAPLPQPKRRTWPWFLGVGVAATLAFAVFWILFNRSNRDDSAGPALQAVADSVLSPREVIGRIGDDVTVEFTVHFVQRAEDVAYVYESEPIDDSSLHFRLAISKHLIASMRKRGSNWPESLDGAVLRFNGQVTRNGRFAEILVADVQQFQKIVHAEKPTVSKWKDKQSVNEAVSMLDAPGAVSPGSQATIPPSRAPSAPEAKKTGKELTESIDEFAKSPFEGLLKGLKKAGKPDSEKP